MALNQRAREDDHGVGIPNYAPIKSDYILIERVVCPGGCGQVDSFNSLSELRRRTAGPRCHPTEDLRRLAKPRAKK